MRIRWISLRDAAAVVATFLIFFTILLATVGLALLVKELAPTVKAFFKLSFSTYPLLQTWL